MAFPLEELASGLIILGGFCPVTQRLKVQTDQTFVDEHSVSGGDGGI